MISNKQEQEQSQIIDLIGDGYSNRYFIVHLNIYTRTKERKLYILYVW